MFTWLVQWISLLVFPYINISNTSIWQELWLKNHSPKKDDTLELKFLDLSDLYSLHCVYIMTAMKSALQGNHF